VNEGREKARQELLKKLDSTKKDSERNRLGQFATPFELASEIIHRAVTMLPSDTEIRFLEPGFGTGTFYSALMNSPFVKRVQLAHGFEIDPSYGEAASWLWRGLGLRLTIADFTKVAPPKAEDAKFNLVVCNPPYVRHHHLSQAQKKELQSKVAQYIGLKINGLSGLYTYFLLLSKMWMSEDGVGAWLIPSEFMDVNYGQAVKQFLLEKVTLQEIHRFDPEEVQFDDALVSSAIVFFTNSPPSKGHKIRFSWGGSLLRPRLSESVDAEYLRHLPKWSALPKKSGEYPRPSHDKILADIFTIKRGVATGGNRFFIITPEQASEYQIPPQFLIPILPSPRYLETNEVTADNNGMPKIKKQLFLLSCNWPEEWIRLKYPSLWQYFKRGMDEAVHERYLCQHRSPWYAQEVRPPAPLLCTYMGRKTKKDANPFRFILNWSKATAPNVYLMLYPKQPLSSLLSSKPGLLKRVWKALSAISVEVFLGEGRVYGGGLYKMEPRELGNIPANTVLEVLSPEMDSMRVGQLSLFGANPVIHDSFRVHPRNY